MDPVTPPSPAILRKTGWQRRALLAVAILSGMLLAISFPLLNLWGLAWVALAPLYCALATCPPRLAGLVGFVFGLVLFLVGLYWMNEIGALPWFVLACIQAVPFAILAVACALLLPRLPAPARPWVFAALWVVSEWARSQGRLAFPWFLLSSSQVRAVPLLQVVSLTGQWGMSFAIAAVNGLLGEAWRARAEGTKKLLRPVAVAVAVMGCLLAYGIPTFLHYDHDAPVGIPRQAVAVVQGSYIKPGQYNGDSATEALSLYLNLTRDAAAANPKPNLIVWPETIVPYGLQNNRQSFDAVAGTARALQTPLLVGTTHYDERDNYYNSASLIDTTGAVTGRYDKVHLVPVGEFFPLRGLLGTIYKRYGVPDRDMTPGSTERSLTLNLPGGGTTRLGSLICYESIFPAHARAQVLNGAQLLILVTSDQTFGTTAGPYQHADQSVVRAIETRRSLFRAASTGISECINPAGRVTASLGVMERGYLSREITLRDEQTLFVRWGDWFVGVCGIGVIAAAMVAALGSKRKI